MFITTLESNTQAEIIGKKEDPLSPSPPLSSTWIIGSFFGTICFPAVSAETNSGDEAHRGVVALPGAKPVGRADTY